MRTLKGIAVSPGVAIGRARVLDPRGRRLPARSIAPEAVAAELARLEAGLDAARHEALAAEADALTRLGPEYAAILGAHARMIDDPTLRRDATDRIRRDLIAAEHAIVEILDALADQLGALTDVYLAARAADVRDILGRILDRLSGTPAACAAPAIPGPAEIPCVVLTHDLSPSQTARLDPGHVLGFATEAGGLSSHTAIVAAALEIPAVVALGPFLDADSRRAAHAIVDGDEGLVILNPDEPTLERYRAASVARADRFAHLAGLASVPSQTRDAHPVELLGNIEFLAEAEICRNRGAGGIGLFRTEFLYLNAEHPPTEDEQYEVYSAVVRGIAGRPVTIRTLDLGADKLPGNASPLGQEANPSLGLRSLRLSLREPSLFRCQLRAILRAAVLGDVRVMFPLVSTVHEFREARQMLLDVSDELGREGVACRSTVPVGAMIEVPAAALMADHLAKEVDFFSIGTNDLIQYTLAVDRTNEHVANLFSAADPSVLRLIRMVVEAARPRQLPVNLCGSMGGEPLFTPLLLGLGVTQLSMPPHQLLEVKRVVRGVSLAEAEALAREVLELDTADAVTHRLREVAATLRAEPTTSAQAVDSRPKARRPGRRRA
jgi:phosphotransferase system enzyme I (PtsI)